MERNDLWLNVKGNYILFKGKIKLIEIQNGRCDNTEFWLFFDASQIMGYTAKSR